MMTEQEYRKAEGINYSALSQFFKSQDHALMPVEPKSYFEIGKIFETMLQDICTGENDFNTKYFKCDVQGTMPDNLISLIESGADLEDEFVYTKTGDRSKTYKTKHAYLDACIEKPGLFPVSNEQYDILSILIENMLKMPLLGATVQDVLSACEWQVPLSWEKDGLQKKALYDCVLKHAGETYLFDIKTAVNEYNFNRMAQTKYWIQDYHYSEGAEITWGNVQSFTFLIAYKEKPYLVEPVSLSGDRGDEYEKLCCEYDKWVKAGKPARGYLPARKIYLYTKN